MRRLFVGDIHGCIEPFERLLDTVSFRPGLDVLHPVGDLVAKGPDSMAVVERCLALDAQGVLGNHDIGWLAKGRLDSHPGLRDGLARWPVVRRLDDAGVLLVHGGLMPTWGEAEIAELMELGCASRLASDAANVRHCTGQGERPPADWPPPDPPFVPWDDHGTVAPWGRLGLRVIFGHWGRRGLSDRPQALGLDTGCVYGGPLTGFVVEPAKGRGGELVQVTGLQ